MVQEGELMLGWWSDVNEPAIDTGDLAPPYFYLPNNAAQRHALLHGRQGGEVVPCGRIICSCFSVGERAISELSRMAYRTPAALGGKTEMRHQLRFVSPGVPKALLAEKQIPV